MVSRALEREYRTDVSMEYIELSNPEIRDQYKDIIQLARDKYMRFPLVMVDGEIVSNGSLDYYFLVAIIVQRLKELQTPAKDGERTGQQQQQKRAG